MNLSQANKRILGAVLAGAVLVFGGIFGSLGPLSWLYGHTLVPAGGGLVQLGSSTGELFANIGNVSNLARDNARLERENADLRQRLAADAETRRDNETLRKQLGLEVAADHKDIVAEVVAFQPDSYRQFVTISKGTGSGIRTGMAVISDGILIGKTLDVSASSARIILVTDPEFKLAAKDQETAAEGMIQGLLGSGLMMDKIGQTDQVKPGDTVVTSGLGGVVPAGLYIGQIESVDSKSNVVFQTAQVLTTLKVGRLRFVSVVVGP